MDREQAKEKFRTADHLFSEGQFGPALKVLTELNAAFPNERHVLYPMARCLTGLGRNAEALDLADRVAREFNYAPAIELYRKLKSMKTGGGLAALESTSDPVLPPGVPTLDSDPVVLPPGVPKFDSDPVKLPSDLDSLIDRPSVAAGVPPPLQASAGDVWKPVALWVGLILGGFLITVAVSLSAGRPFLDYMAESFEQGRQLAENPDAEPPAGIEPSPADVRAMWLVILTMSAYWYLPTCLCAYFALKVMGALPFGDFGEDMKDVAKYNLIGYILSWFLLIGWIPILIIIKNHYEMNLGRTLVTSLLYNIFSSILSIPIGIAYLVTVIQLA